MIAYKNTIGNFLNLEHVSLCQWVVGDEGNPPSLKLWMVSGSVVLITDLIEIREITQFFQASHRRNFPPERSPGAPKYESKTPRPYIQPDRDKDEPRNA